MENSPLVVIQKVEIHNHNVDDSKLNLIISNQQQIMGTLADIQAQNTALIAAVADEDTVIDSAVTLITGFGAQLTALQAQLAAAVAANDPTAIQAVVDSMTATIADIAAKKNALADAVAAGTPAA
jgi:hypothetical protein